MLDTWNEWQAISFRGDVSGRARSDSLGTGGGFVEGAASRVIVVRATSLRQ